MMILCPHCREACQGRCSRAIRPSRRWFIFGALGAALAPKVPLPKPQPQEVLWKGGRGGTGLMRAFMPVLFAATPVARPNEITLIAPVDGYRIVGSPDGSRWYYVADAAQADLSPSKVRSGRMEVPGASVRWA